MDLFVVADQIQEWLEKQNQCFGFELYCQNLVNCFDLQGKQMQLMVVEQLNQIQNFLLLSQLITKIMSMNDPQYTFIITYFKFNYNVYN